MSLGDSHARLDRNGRRLRVLRRAGTASPPRTSSTGWTLDTVGLVHHVPLLRLDLSQDGPFVNGHVGWRVGIVLLNRLAVPSAQCVACNPFNCWNAATFRLAVHVTLNVRARARTGRVLGRQERSKRRQFLLKRVTRGLKSSVGLRQLGSSWGSKERGQP